MIPPIRLEAAGDHDSSGPQGARRARRRSRTAGCEGAWFRRGYGLAAFLIFLLYGCAASAPMPSPADYPLHTVALPPAEYPSSYPVPGVAPQIEIHWRLTVDSNRVQADGLLERQRDSQINEAWLQLLGIDATGRTVSFTAPVRFTWRSPGPLESFSLALKPRGGEQRYEVRLYMFEFAPQLRGSRGRG